MFSFLLMLFLANAPVEIKAVDVQSGDPDGVNIQSGDPDGLNLQSGDPDGVNIQ